MANLLRLLCRIYQVLLYAYPADFRRRYGAEMVQVFRDRAGDAAQASGLGGLLPFGIHCGFDWLSTTIRERVDSTRDAAEGPVIAAYAIEGVPGFYTCESYFPRRSALINGGIWTLAAFSAVCSAIDHPGVRYTFRSTHGGSYVASQPQVIETGESGPAAFGRSLLTSASGALGR